MRIAVNTRLLLSGKLDGIGWFTYETLKRITCNHPEHEFIFIFDRKPAAEFIFSSNITPVIASPQARHPVLWYLFFDWGVTAALKKNRADFFLSPDGWLSLRANVPSLPVIHDLNFEHYPQFLPWHVKKYYDIFFHRFAQKAKRIATVSEYTKSDIVKTYQIPAERIDVVYNGAGENYKPLPAPEIEAVRKKYTSGCPYFLFVGTIHPRKNLKNLLLAFDDFKTISGSNYKLLVVGSKKWWPADIEEVYTKMRSGNDVVFTGRAEQEELSRMTAAAFALTYVSFFEGFGIPLVEAMNCHVPVITSDVTSMPEIGGDAALYADPFSVESITNALLLLYKDDTLRKKLISNGITRHEAFSWQKSADKLWLSIEKAL